MVFFDTESTVTTDRLGGPEAHRFRLGVAVHLRREGGVWCRRKVLRFTEAADFWTWLAERLGPRRPCWAFAHNIGFDLTMLDFWGRLDRREYWLRDPADKRAGPPPAAGPGSKPWRGAFIINDPPTMIAVRSLLGTLRFCDTLNYWRTSLEKLGQAVGLDKLPLPAIGASQAEWFDRCERDVEILERAVCGLMDRWEAADAGCWQPTAAGLSFSAFRHTKPLTKIWVDHSDLHTSLAREAYYGGQAEAYYQGPILAAGLGQADPRAAKLAGRFDRPCGPVYMLDVRSFYPAIMANNYFPVRFKRVDLSGCLESLRIGLRSYLAIARVSIDSQDLAYPVRKDGRLLFANGLFTTTLAGPELKQAFSRGHIAKLGPVAYYEPGRPFTGFVERWFGKRLEAIRAGRSVDEEFYKLILDALSGKFAQHKIRWKDAPDRPAVQRWGEWYSIDAQTRVQTKFRGVAGLTQEFTHDGEGRDAFVPISAFITSYGRCYMAELRELAGPRGCLYQDTDSLLVDGAGLDRLHVAGLLGDDGLGSLQCKWSADSGHIYGPRDYQCGGRRKIAGVREKAKEESPGVFTQEQWQRLRDVLSERPRGVVMVHTARLTMTRDSQARSVLPTGWTRPLTITASDLLPF